MKKSKLATLVCISTFTLAAHAAEDMKLGFGFDKGFGASGQFGSINAFIGNDGTAVDYIFKRGQFGDPGSLVKWYLGGGAFVEWNNKGHGVRMPFGASIPLGSSWDIYGQLAPELDFKDNVDFHLTGALGIRYAF